MKMFAVTRRQGDMLFSDFIEAMYFKEYGNGIVFIGENQEAVAYYSIASIEMVVVSKLNTTEVRAPSLTTETDGVSCDDPLCPVCGVVPV